MMNETVNLFDRITAADLDSATYKLDYHLEGAMAADQPLIVAGSKKTLKTSILLDAAISLASGQPFLGTIAVQKRARVAVMSGESGLATLQETCRRIAVSKAMTLTDVPGLIFSSRLPWLDSQVHLDALQKYLTRDDIEVVILDPAYLAMSGDDAGNLFKQGQVLRRLTETCQAAGASIVLAHHNRKAQMNRFSRPELDDMAWAGFGEFARQWWLVGRRTKYEPGTGRHELWLDIGGSAGHSALWALDIDEGRPSDPGGRRWQVTLRTAAEARDKRKKGREVEQRAEKLERAKAAIEKAFKGAPKETKHCLLEKSKARGEIFDEALEMLVTEGKVVPASVQKSNGQSYPGYEFVAA